MFKVKNELSSEFKSDVFTQRINNMRNINHFETHFVRAICNETEGVSYLQPKISDVVPEQYKKLNNVNSFKESIKK